MIISKTPFRISFFGGGTDYPTWFKENGGSVLSTTIDKFCYITCRELPPFFDHKHHLVYSRDEKINKIVEIKHPSIKAVFNYLNIQKGLEIHHDADLPARSGLGSSSAFTVGLINALYAQNNSMISSKDLALKAIYIEQEVIKESVGSQDQVAAAYGGFNKINFNQDCSIDATRIIASPKRLDDLNDHLLFVFTGFTRIASDIARQQIMNTKDIKTQLIAMSEMVDEGIKIIKSENKDLEEFGKLLHESWCLKRSLTKKISNSEIDDIYDLAKKSGAIGGKLTGAGGGGFMLLFAKPECHKKIKQQLSQFLFVPIKFEKSGSKIIYFES